MDFSDSSTLSTASGKDYHYVVLQVTLKEKFLGYKFFLVNHVIGFQGT